MIDVKLPLRTAYYQLLHNSLFYNSANIPVSDGVEKVNDMGNIFVILSTQSASDTSTFQSFDSYEQMLVKIVFRSQARANKQVLDVVAGQILNLVLPAPSFNGLPAQAGVIIQNVQKVSDTTTDLQLNTSTTVIQRLITFAQTVRQSTSIFTPPISPSGMIAQVSNETPTGLVNGVNKTYTLANKYLTGTSVDVYLNGIRQAIGVHYTVSPPNQIIFADAPLVDALDGPDRITVDYISTP